MNNRLRRERLLLQVSIGIGALVPLIGGGAGVLPGAGLFPAGADPFMDSHLRYLSGLLLAIGLGYWSAIPAIEQKTGLIRLLTALVVAGGLARLATLPAGGALTPGIAFALLMELGVTPLLCLWQGRFAGRTARAKSGDKRAATRSTVPTRE